MVPVFCGRFFVFIWVLCHVFCWGFVISFVLVIGDERVGFVCSIVILRNRKCHNLQYAGHLTSVFDQGAWGLYGFVGN